MKKVCFIGHRDEWRCLGIDKKLEEEIEKVIKRGYFCFYDGNKGAFDNLCLDVLLRMKIKYPQIKIIRVLVSYTHKKENVPGFLDEVLVADVEHLHFKQRITKRNEWIIDNSDIVICHITNTIRSGAYKAYCYAKKKNKEIVCIGH